MRLCRGVWRPSLVSLFLKLAEVGGRQELAGRHLGVAALLGHAFRVSKADRRALDHAGAERLAADGRATGHSGRTAPVEGAAAHLRQGVDLIGVLLVAAARELEELLVLAEVLAVLQRLRQLVVQGFGQEERQEAADDGHRAQHDEGQRRTHIALGKNFKN